LKKRLKQFYELCREAIETGFLTGLRDWQESKEIKNLREVEKQFFLNYAHKSYPVYIFRERQKFGYYKFNFAYGETPYSIGKLIVEKAGITGNDVVYDLGCGRGKFLFFINLYTGARCVGVDLLPIYIKTANKIVEKVGLNRIDFFQEDIINVDLFTASVVMIHGTTFVKEIHESVKEKINHMKPGSRIISISVPYHHPKLELMHKEYYLFSWGKGTAFFYKVV
jgi:cyclopropane fatty-acyl-phospholipid synthase-like methyltransferase